MSESTPAYKAPLFEPLARQPASQRVRGAADLARHPQVVTRFGAIAA